MLNRVLLILFAAFWLVMNFLLWRSEFRPEGVPGESIPAAQVLEKIFRSADLSSMEIRLRGERIGYCRILATQSGELPGENVTLENTPVEGEVRRLISYTLDMDGMITGLQLTNRYRFFSSLMVTTNLDWQTFSLQLSHRPHQISLNAYATNQTLVANYKQDELNVQHTFTFEQLRNPQRLATELGGPLVGILIGGAASALPAGWQHPEQLAEAVRWEARNDKLKINQGFARVYRLSADLGERRRVVIIVSRVGEILKVELPQGITLVNDEARL